MKSILLIDDSATLLESMHRIVHHSGFESTKADSAEAALQHLDGGLRPDLIITDLNMPGMNGIELIGKIRAMRSFRFTPILLLTTESRQSKREDARSAGATGWLTKPVTPRDLLGVIKQVLPGA